MTLKNWQIGLVVIVAVLRTGVAAATSTDLSFLVGTFLGSVLVFALIFTGGNWVVNQVRSLGDPTSEQSV